MRYQHANDRPVRFSVLVRSRRIRLAQSFGRRRAYRRAVEEKCLPLHPRQTSQGMLAELLEDPVAALLHQLQRQLLPRLVISPRYGWIASAPDPAATFPGVYTDPARSSPANHQATPAPLSPASRCCAVFGSSSTTSPPSCYRRDCSRECSLVAGCASKTPPVTTAGTSSAHPPSGHHCLQGFHRLPCQWQGLLKSKIHPPDYNWFGENCPAIYRTIAGCVKFAQRSTEDSNDSFRTPGFECPDQKVCDITQDWLPHKAS